MSSADLSSLPTSCSPPILDIETRPWGAADGNLMTQFLNAPVTQRPPLLYQLVHEMVAELWDGTSVYFAGDSLLLAQGTATRDLRRRKDDSDIARLSPDKAVPYLTTNQWTLIPPPPSRLYEGAFPVQRKVAHDARFAMLQEAFRSLSLCHCAGT